jgi:hypothetical protein
MREHAFEYLLALLHCVSIAKGYFNGCVLRLGGLLGSPNLGKLVVVILMCKGNEYPQRLFH